MTLSVTIKTQFEAAVHLYDYAGPCSNIHGHTYQIAITFSSVNQAQDMVVDYYEAKKWVEQITQQLDHQYINQIKPFDKINPTTENLICWISEQVSTCIDNANIFIKRVTLSENNNFTVEYEPNT